jgi:hypothetical protein
VAALLRVAERLNFRVRQARAPMPAAPDDFSAFHQNGADHRVRRSRAIAAPREAQGKEQMMKFIISNHNHPKWKFGMRLYAEI